MTNRAKEIRRRSGGSWKAALKKAGAEMRGKKTIKRKRSGSRSTKKRKSVGVVWPSGVGSTRPAKRTFETKDEETLQIARVHLMTLIQLRDNVKKALKGKRGEQRKAMKQIISIRNAQIRQAKTELRLLLQRIRLDTKQKLKRLK
jgi:hypothetical protein